MSFDAAKARADFPILARRIGDKPLVYLDNAASAQKPMHVLDAMRDCAAHSYANVHRGLHQLSNEATASYEGAREAVRAYLNAAAAGEIIFTSGATDAINLVAQSYVQPRIEAGDEIILSVLEHHSNIVPWHFLRERQGAVLKWVPLDDSGQLDMAAYEKLLSPRTKLVAVTQMSNALGSVPDAARIIALAHRAGVPVLLDGCQGAVHLPTDVQALGVDFYVMSSHKLYGPTGIGVLYAKAALAKEMRPYRGGGEMIRAVTQASVSYGDAPHRFEAGTPPILEAVGLAAALAYIEKAGRPAIHAHEAALARYARALLADMPRVILYGGEDSAPIIPFTVAGVHPHDIATVLDRAGIAVRAGHHCAQPLMEDLGVTALTRASIGLYNSRDEIAAFAAALAKAIDFFGAAA